MKAERDSTQVLAIQKIFRLPGGIIFLPHYHIKGLYVGPDKLARTPAECMALGAWEDNAMLWPRNSE